MIVNLALLAALALLPTSTTGAPPRQSAAEPVFEVASLQVNRSGDLRRQIGPAPGGRFVALNQTLRDLLAFAYGLPQATAAIQTAGGPVWLDVDRFDIQAKAD